MNTQPDFEELLRFLGERNVDYMIVGGYAVAFHGHPRFTKDIDIFFQISEDNIERLRSALMDFGFDSEELPPELFSSTDNVLMFGVAPSELGIWPMLRSYSA